MSNTLYVLRNSNMRVMRNEVYMSTFHNSRSYSWFQYCVVDFKMKWSLSGCVVWKPWPVISLLNAVRWQLLLSVRQTRSKIKSCLLKCFQHCNIPNYRKKKLVRRQTRERLGGEKKGCVSNDEGNHFILILPLQIFLTREITGLSTSLQRFLSEDDEELLTSEILNSLANEERPANWQSGPAERIFKWGG